MNTDKGTPASAHEILAGRRSYTPMSRWTKRWIVWMRAVQLGLRVLQLGGAVGILVLMILITNVDPMAAWVMRITVRRAAPSLRKTDGC